MQALHFNRLKTFPDDQFGAAAADIDDQATFLMARNSLCNSQVDQARFFTTGYYINAAAQRSLCDHQEVIGIF